MKNGNNGPAVHVLPPSAKAVPRWVIARMGIIHIYRWAGAGTRGLNAGILCPGRESLLKSGGTSVRLNEGEPVISNQAKTATD